MSRTIAADCGGTSKATPNGSVFFSSVAGLRANLELVALAVRQIGHENLPDAGGREQPHRVDAAVPAVEVADDADAIGVGRPHGEVHARRRPHASCGGRPVSRTRDGACPRRTGADRSRSAPGRSGTDRRSRRVLGIAVADTRSAGGSRPPDRSTGAPRTARPGGAAPSGGARRSAPHGPRSTAPPAATPARPTRTPTPRRADRGRANGSRLTPLTRAVDSRIDDGEAGEFGHLVIWSSGHFPPAQPLQSIDQVTK